MKTAAASVALAVQPANAALVSASGAVAPAGGPLFAVISPGKAWAVCSNYHEAYHHASMIRHSGGVCTSHVRCTPAFAEQVRAGTLNSFIEIDGWAATSHEAEVRGLDLLRNALDRASARRQLLGNYRRIASVRIDAADRDMADNFYYVQAQFDDGEPARIIAVAMREDGALLQADAWLLDSGEDRRIQLEARLCTRDLFDRLQKWFANDGPMPEIVAKSARHMTYADYGNRLEADPMFRFAMNDGAAPAAACDPAHRFIAFDRHDKWIYGTGDNEVAALGSAAWAGGYVQGRELLASRASSRLVSAVRERGIEFPGFWQRAGRIARHESEMLTTQPSAAKRHALRPPIPEWKQR